MRIMRDASSFFTILLIIGSLDTFGQDRIPEECVQTAQMDVYSDAHISKDTGDLNGFELAVEKPNGSPRKALLFMYEGAASDGIPIGATTDGNKLAIDGTWIEHLTEYPSKRDIVQTHRVRINAILTANMLRGTISIEGLEIINPDKMRLKRVKQIWVCRRASSQ